jgi:hypothetical protein
MTLYTVTGVTLDDGGRVLNVAATLTDGATNKAIGRPGVLDSGHVAKLIGGGATVQAVFIHEDSGMSVAGQNFRPVTFNDGTEGIELEPQDGGRTVHDLVQLSGE